MNDYKDTLNLPNTNFPMKGNLANREPERLAAWENEKLYEKIRKLNKSKKKFILHDGPPYANGSIHIGHAVNKILKDIIIKAKTLDDYDTPYVPGWDCHGLPIELNVEKKVGKPGHKVSAKEFRQACRDFASKQVLGQREDFKRLGIFGDWNNPYLTMDFHFEANVIRALGKIIDNGHLHKGFKPVHWCMDCGSALAEAEVEYADKESLAVDVLFPVVDKKIFLSHFNVTAEKEELPLAVVIWTTTPWTLPANQAVALNPDLSYALIEYEAHGERACIIIAESLVDSVMQRYGFLSHNILATCLGKKLENLLLQHPFYDRKVPVILGDHVTTDAGTGAVHTAPGHGVDDFVVGQQYNLDILTPVDERGVFTSQADCFTGEHVFKANQKIVDLLQEKHHLLHNKKLVHSYPHCWRHKSPVIFRATPQWFISMSKNGLLDKAKRAVDQVQWVPDWGKARIDGMLADRPDWCISRQRTWGVPIPLFVHKQTKELHPNTSGLIEKVAQQVELSGVDGWSDLTPVELLGEQASEYEKVTDTLDVWFDSGVTHECVLNTNEKLQFPADLYLEGSDQHRGWFQSSLLTSIAMNETAPYKTVLTHGFTVDASGRKMSKSLGNVIAPQKIVNNLGADILRLWVASTDYRGEITVSDEILKRMSDAYRRIRNTARFMVANLHDFEPEQHLVELNDLLALDKWLIDRAYQLQQEIIKAYDEFQFHVVYQKIHNFCVVELGGFYLDIIKDRQYTMQKNSRGRRSAQSALFHVLEAFCRWLAPILSFTADELWAHVPGQRQGSVFLTQWYDQLVPLLENSQITSDDWQQIIKVKTAVNQQIEAAREAKLIGSNLAADIELYCNGQLSDLLIAFGDELRFLLITSSAIVKPLDQANETMIAVDNLNLKLLLSAASNTKCIRCWHHRQDVGKEEKHPELCGRCIDNIDHNGESRHFA